MPYIVLCVKRGYANLQEQTTRLPAGVVIGSASPVASRSAKRAERFGMGLKTPVS